MKFKNRIFLSLTFAFCFIFICESQASNQPYIDQVIRENQGNEVTPNSDGTPASNSPYLDALQSKLRSERSEEPAGSYIKELQATDPLRDKKGDENYLGKLKDELPPLGTSGAIQAYHEGKSELEFKRPGAIHYAMGIRYSILAPNRSIQGNWVSTDFNNIYGGIYAPELEVFYEYQPFHSEWFGNIGIIGSVGAGYYYGVGRYSISIPKPGNPSLFFPANSATRFQFFTVPVTLALIYRFNLIRIFRPYFRMGPTVVGYLESRNDDGPVRTATSLGLTTTLGVSILMDWLSHGSSWELYSGLGVKHYYLTLDFTRLATLNRGIQFDNEVVAAGLTFEY